MQSELPLEEATAAFQRGDLGRARELTQSLVDSGPTAQSIYLMGMIECRSGRFDAGAEWLARATGLDPANLNYRLNWAKALIDSSRHEEALRICQPPAGSSPRELALWHMRAVAADAVQAWHASAEAWAVLCRTHPADWRMWNNAAHALGKLSRWPEAAKALRRAIEASPADLSLRRSLVTALGRAGRHEESADELKRFIEASPNDVGMRVMYARLLNDLGNQAEVCAQLDAAARLVGATSFDCSADLFLALAHQSGETDLDIGILRELALLFDGTNRWEALDALFEAAEQIGVKGDQLGYPAAAAALRQGKPDEARRLLLAQAPETNPIRWHWLMARIADALGDSETAFAEAMTMNNSEPDREPWRARGQRHIDFVCRLGDRVTPEWAAQVKTARPNARRSPAFLVGFPRSGTTLLDTFLMGHPATTVLEEVPVIDAALQMVGDLDDLPKRSHAQLERARDAYFEEIRSHVDPDSAGMVIDKMPLNMLAAPLLHSLFPDAPIIFAQRHPCDVVLSCFMQGFAMNESMACFLDIETAAGYYDAAMRLWTRSRDALGLRVHTVVYEDLVADPEAVLRPLVEFLGLDWYEELLDHQRTAKGRPTIGTASYNQVTEILSRAPSGRWRRYEKHLEPVLPILLPWAERLGYRQ